MLKEWFLSQKEAKSEKLESLKAEVITFKYNAKFGYVIFRGKKKKTKEYSLVGDIRERDIKLGITLYKEELKMLEKQEKKEASKVANRALFGKVQVGDVFVSSWGYDQTNVDSYQVVEKKGISTLVLREISNRTIKGSEGFMSCDVMPEKDSFINDSLYIKRLSDSVIKIDSSRRAKIWDGKTSYYQSWYA